GPRGRAARPVRDAALRDGRARVPRRHSHPPAGRPHARGGLPAPERRPREPAVAAGGRGEVPPERRARAVAPGRGRARGRGPRSGRRRRPRRGARAPPRGGAAEASMKPLEDVRILAVEQYGAGPFGTLHLADLGAEVIKIEAPATGGDVARYVPPG